jgi:beta-glucanase (GH16 family)
MGPTSRLTDTSQYHNNSQEIDMEFLSHQFNESQGAVNLVLQSPQSVTKGYDASGTSGYTLQELPFRPDQKFHEYRFDWTPDRVAFYIDGQFIYDRRGNIPTEGGAVFFNHWSNGDQRWSAGPPTSDTVMTISYMKSFFNSTNTERSRTAYKERCPSYDASKVCVIPSQKGPPDASVGKNAAKTYFFSHHNDMTPGQVTYNSAAITSRAQSRLLAMAFLGTFLSWALTP